MMRTSEPPHWIASQAAGEPLPRAQEFLRVDRLAFKPRFVVQVRSGRAPGRADVADDLSGLDGLADANGDRRQVTVAGRQSVAVIDVDRAAIAATPARGGHRAVGGGAHRVAGLAMEIEPGMHGRPAQEWVDADAEARLRIELAVNRLAHGNGAERAREPSDLRTRDLNAMKLALEAHGVLGHLRGDERTAHRAGTVAGRGLAGLEAEFDQHAAHAPRLRIVIVRDRVDHCRLALFEAIERGLQAGDDAADAAGAFGEKAAARIARGAVDWDDEGALVVGWFERDCPRLAGPSPARRRLDRTGHVAEAVERAGARLQRCLPAQNLVELLLVLLLVEQLAARKAVDLGAQLGDAILVAELHLRVARDQPGEDVLAEGEIGGGADGPPRHDHQRADHHPKGDRPDAQLASGMDEAQARPPRRCGALRPAGMIAMVVLCRRPSRHSRFPAGSVRQPALRAR